MRIFTDSYRADVRTATGVSETLLTTKTPLQLLLIVFNAGFSLYKTGNISVFLLLRTDFFILFVRFAKPKGDLH